VQLDETSDTENSLARLMETAITSIKIGEKPLKEMLNTVGLPARY
jgi:DNA-binding TFAR19-related protein (PDSD5 family)